METLPLNIPSYPMLRFITRWGGWLTSLAALTITGAGLYAGFASGNVVYLIAGPITGVIVFVLIRTLVESVRLITDMLLPK